jgi:hypothetical protein
MFLCYTSVVKMKSGKRRIAKKFKLRRKKAGKDGYNRAYGFMAL